jgi:hypothetical protein
MRRFATPLALVLGLLVLLAACAQLVGPGSPSGFAERARQVIKAWDATGFEQVWRTGFVPLEELRRLEGDGSATIYRADLTAAEQGNAKVALSAGWFRLSGPGLPTVWTKTGQVGFPDGATVAVPLISAADAFALLRTGDASASCVGTGCTLGVTGATATTMQVQTSRGAAVVPAWRFEVAELAVGLLYAAVAPTAISMLPTVSIDPSGALTAVDAVAVGSASGATGPGATGASGPGGTGAVGGTGVTGVPAQSATRLRLQFFGGACDRSRTGLFYETPAAVVVGVSMSTPA